MSNIYSSMRNYEGDTIEEFLLLPHGIVSTHMYYPEMGGRRVRTVFMPGTMVRLRQGSDEEQIVPDIGALLSYRITVKGTFKLAESGSMVAEKACISSVEWWD